jgi:tripartite-type tricarboxylate transporter receptor subunit TctC
MMTARAACGALLALVLYAGHAQAEYPDHTIRLVVPFAPGGANDSVARMVADKLGNILGQAVIVDNRPGGGMVVGSNSVATANPDGYTLLLISPAHVINPYIKDDLPYQTLGDFTPISQITRSAYVLVTSSQSPFKTVQDFGPSAHPSGITFASAGPGSVPHLAGQYFLTLLGAKFVQVPYQGGSPAMIGVIRRDVDMYFSSVAGAQSFVASKQVRAIAVSSDMRVRALPDVPTVAEAGVTGFGINGWYGIVGPKGMPADITSKLNKAIQKALTDPDLVARLQNEGEEVAGGTPEEFSALLKSDYEKYRIIVASAGVEPK